MLLCKHHSSPVIRLSLYPLPRVVSTLISCMEIPGWSVSIIAAQIDPCVTPVIHESRSSVTNVERDCTCGTLNKELLMPSSKIATGISIHRCSYARCLITILTMLSMEVNWKPERSSGVTVIENSPSISKRI